MKLRLLRKEKGLTQQAVADYVGIPRPSVSEIERGERDISVLELVKFSELFKKNVSQILISKKAVSEISGTKKNEMRIYFVRHGEAMDDLYNQYGGWADPDLSARGVNKAFTVARNLAERDLKIDRIFTSPLKRAKKKAEIIARELDMNAEVTQFLKERNTYGLLCGMNKELAQKKFPELVKDYEEGEYVLASERYEDFVNRLDLLFKFLLNQKAQTILCVTHGKLLKAVIKEYLHMNPSNIGDGCLLVVGFHSQGIYYIESEGIKFTYKGLKK